MQPCSPLHAPASHPSQPATHPPTHPEASTYRGQRQHSLQERRRREVTAGQNRSQGGSIITPCLLRSTCRLCHSSSSSRASSTAAACLRRLRCR